MKIAFSGNFQYHCGSSNALLGYVKAGEKLGYDVRASEFGNIDKVIRKKVRVADKDWKPDIFVIVYESYPFLSDEDIIEIKTKIPRKKRILIDPDGRYLLPVSVEGDTNHPDKESYAFWHKLYDSLSDIILQPLLGNSNNLNNVHSFLYFGVDQSVANNKSIKKDFDLLYVGNNWYRWDDICGLVDGLSLVRNRIKKIGLIGRYWDDELMEKDKSATFSDPEFLIKNDISFLESAPYGQVEKAMGRGFMNPIFIRPILNKLKLFTPRMFETFVADTVPLIPKYFDHAPYLYGEAIKELTLSDNPADDLIRIMDDYGKYKDLAQKIQKSLIKKHSYEVRLKELLNFI